MRPDRNGRKGNKAETKPLPKPASAKLNRGKVKESDFNLEALFQHLMGDASDTYIEERFWFYLAPKYLRKGEVLIPLAKIIPPFN